MSYHITAPRLLFLYPRVARAVLSPDTRGQVVFPYVIESEKDTFAAAQRKGEDYLNSYYKNISDRIRHSNSRNRRCKSKYCRGLEIEVARYAVAASPIAHRVPREKRFHTTTKCRQSIKPQRYGTANEPPPYLQDKRGTGVDSQKEEDTRDGGIGDAAASESNTATVGGKKGKKKNELLEKRNDSSRNKLRSMPGQQHLFRADGRLVEDSPDNEADEDVPDAEKKSLLPEAEVQDRSKQTKIGEEDSNGDESTDDHGPNASSEDDKSNTTTKPSLQQTILQAQSSSELLDDSSQKKLLLRNNHNAHLSSSSSSSSSSMPPRSPYFHHFDTYTMARNLQDGGFSEKQAATVMKAMRVTLTKNLERAKNALVSKSNVENDTYLFRAACSELRTEVQNNRKKADDRMRNDRNQLDHEAEILNQRVQQESQNLKDNLKGMFDDRKMAVRMEQKAMESRIQELDYTITVALQSDARSAVEGLRWILVRRAAIAIVISAVMILATLRYSSYMSHTQEIERQKMKASQQNNHNSNNSNNVNPADFETNNNSPSAERHLSTDVRHQSADEEILVRAQEGNGPGYVSLG